MSDFTETNSYAKILDFIEQVMNSIKNDVQSHNNKIKGILKALHKILTKIKPASEPQRFGNVAFRNFHKEMVETLKTILIHNNIKHTTETIYLTESFGNLTRLDYGTGHELNFLCYLYVLFVSDEIKIYEVRNALDSYFDLARAVINKYNLEPAGSHGVWGIDDYQLLPFLLGSVELFEKNITFKDLVLTENDFIYGKALKFVKAQKTKHRDVPFEQHSPILYEFRKKGWPAINHELFIRYKNDVLESSAVNQHFIFSKILTK